MLNYIIRPNGIRRGLDNYNNNIVIITVIRDTDTDFLTNYSSEKREQRATISGGYRGTYTTTCSQRTGRPRIVYQDSQQIKDLFKSTSAKKFCRTTLGILNKFCVGCHIPNVHGDEEMEKEEDFKRGGWIENDMRTASKCEEEDRIEWKLKK
ncbi:Hypothetical protein CINCED_3A010217 [Cinara cedri]|uniref:Uncharacterized protein n=1 Tax=Cinara cedri TaxID=506608 RepID=A0A5E4LZ76_9HEMI|nr:Hypothetical protein CINCED_3A010217 [Cinara cedri]